MGTCEQNSLLFVIDVMLEIEPRTLCELGKPSASKLQPIP